MSSSSPEGAADEALASDTATVFETPSKDNGAILRNGSFGSPTGEWPLSSPSLDSVLHGVAGGRTLSGKNRPRVERAILDLDLTEDPKDFSYRDSNYRKSSVAQDLRRSLRIKLQKSLKSVERIFGRLPGEIQVMIWEHVAADAEPFKRCVILRNSMARGFRDGPWTALPGLFQVNADARRAFMKTHRYKMMFARKFYQLGANGNLGMLTSASSTTQATYKWHANVDATLFPHPPAPVRVLPTQSALPAAAATSVPGAAAAPPTTHFSGWAIHPAHLAVLQPPAANLGPFTPMTFTQLAARPFQLNYTNHQLVNPDLDIVVYEPCHNYCRACYCACRQFTDDDRADVRFLAIRNDPALARPNARPSWCYISMAWPNVETLYLVNNMDYVRNWAGSTRVNLSHKVDWALLRAPESNREKNLRERFDSWKEGINTPWVGGPDSSINKLEFVMLVPKRPDPTDGRPKGAQYEDLIKPFSFKDVILG